MKRIIPVLLIALVSVYKLQADHTLKSNFNQVSIHDTENSTPFSYQLGMTYYKDAMKIVDNMDPNSELIVIIETQDRTVELLKKSLQLMKAAERIDPNDMKIQKALNKIYKALNMTGDSKQLASR